MPLPEQHGRTHCPSGSDPLPCLGYPYVVRKMTSGQAIGSHEFISWDESDFDEADGYFTAGDAESFNIIGPGVFDFVAACHYDPEMNAIAQIKFQCDGLGPSYNPTGWGKGGLYTPGGSLLSGDDTIMVAFTARLVSGTSATAVVVGHEHASSQTLEWAFCRVARIGDWSGNGLGAEGDFPTLF